MSGRVLDLLREEEEEILLDLAVARGCLTPRQAVIARGTGGDPVAEALRLGILTPAQLEGLRGDRRRRDLDQLQTGVALPDEVVRARLDPLRVLDRYTLVEPLGRGGSGTVWRAWDASLQRWVAMKLPRQPVSDALRSRFLREARVAAGLRHPDLVAVHDVGVARGQPYLVMELIQGKPLDPSVGPRDVAGLLRDVATALDAAHRQGIVHRDLKPQNILVDGLGRPHVVDFGLAHTEEAGRSMTQTGATLGTPVYMAPEQVRGGRDVSPRTDVHALGVILYEALSGRLPYEADNDAEMFARILHREPAPPRRLNREAPADLAAVCMKAMEKDPARRYATAADFAADLERYLSGRPVLAKPTTILTRGARWARRRPAGVAAAAVAAVVVAAAALAWTLQVRGISSSLKEERSAAQISSMLYELNMKTSGALRHLEDVCYGAAGTDDDNSAVRQIDIATRAVATRYKGLTAPQAWRGLTDHYTGWQEKGMATVDRACDAAGPDPFPHVIRARIYLDRYARQVVIPFFRWDLDSGHVSMPAPRIDAAMVQDQAEALKSIERARLLPVWTHLEHGHEIESFVDGVVLLARSDYATAVVRFKEATGDPGLEGQAIFFRGFAFYQAGQPLRAAEAWDSLRRRGWTNLDWLACTARVAQLLTPAGADTDPQGVIDALLQAIERDPSGRLTEFRPLSLAWYFKSRFERRQGRDPGPAVERAVAACQGPGALESFWRACLEMKVARDERDAGRDPRAWYARVVADLGDESGFGTDRPGFRVRGCARAESAVYSAGAGGDAEADLELAAADLERAMAGYPPSAGLLHSRANVRSVLALVRGFRSQPFAEEWTQALADYRAAADLRRDDPAILASWAEFTEKLSSFSPDPVLELAKALDLAERILVLDRSSSSVSRRAGLRIHRATVRVARGKCPGDDFELALADLDHAIALDPKDDQPRVLRGVALGAMAEWEVATGGDPAPLRLKAVENLDEALRLRESREGFAERGIVLGKMRRIKEALADLSRSLAIQPNQPALRGQLERLQKRVEW